MPDSEGPQPTRNTFLLRALADDPLMTMSLVPKKTQIDQTIPSTSESYPPSYPFQVESLEDFENINKPAILASTMDQEVAGSDSDLPSSVVDEIEVHSKSLNLKCAKFTSS
jgi:hypothetical protein